MLDDKYRDMLREVAKTGDIERIDDVIRTIKVMSPNSFFKDSKDPALAKRVFVHQPYSSHWSGRALTDKKAWSIIDKRTY